MKSIRLTLCALALGLLTANALAQSPDTSPAPANREANPDAAGLGSISPAQRAVFTNHLQNARPGTTIEYRFAHRGSLDKPFDDTVKLVMLPEDAATSPDGGPPTAVAFLTGPRRAELAPRGDPSGNPVILYFLERDAREMERLTGGKAGYHQRRIKIALAEDQAVEPIEIDWDGRKVPARRVTITPYQDFAHADLKPKYGPFLGKRYEFVLSDAVPGTLYSMRAFVPGGEAPMMEDTLVLVGVKQGASTPKSATPPSAREKEAK